MSKTIPLTKGLVTLVDDEDYETLSRYRWHANVKTPRHVYAARWFPRGHRIQMHRLITGAADGQEVDHIDHDGLNNTKANLRLCTRKENSRNKSLHKNSSTGYKGVYKLGPAYKTNRYYSMIYADGRNYYLGAFRTALDAAKAYSLAAKRLHGEFALYDPRVDDGAASNRS